MQTCYQCENLADRLNSFRKEYLKISSDLKKDPKVLELSSSEMITVGNQLNENLNQLGLLIYEELVQRIAEEFIDISSPSRKLAELLTMPLGKSFC